MFSISDLEIVTENDDASVVSFVPGDGCKNINGAIHGGIIFLLCDEAIGRYVTAKGRKGAASSSEIHYYRPGMAGKKMTATVSDRKVGKRLGVFLVELKNEEGALLADALFTVAFMD